MAGNAISWGNPQTIEAPYWLLFSCHAYSKFYQDRAVLNQLLAEIMLPGTIIARGTVNRYNDDAPLQEGMQHLRASLGGGTSKDRFGGEFEGSIFDDITERTFSDTFGNIQRSAGRLDLVTSESVYMGASRRRYQMNWNLISGG